MRDHPLVAQCIVVGNDRPYIAALVTLDQEAVEHWLRMRGKPPMRPADLVRDPDLETEVRRAVVAANTLVSQAESIRTFRILAPAVHRGARAAHPVAEAEAQGDRDGVRDEVDALQSREQRKPSIGQGVARPTS